MNRKQRKVYRKALMAEFNKPERRRGTAFHEAGHAAIYYFLDTRSDFFDVDIRPTLTRAGRCRGRNLFEVLYSGSWATLNRATRDILRVGAIRGIMHNLVGFAAQHRAGDQDPDWLKLELFTDPDEWEDDPGHELNRAVTLARKACNGKRHWGFLFRVARWIDEMLREPGMWRVVEALAKELLLANRLGRKRALKIMDRAWDCENNCHLPPWCALGKKWIRRLSEGAAYERAMRKRPKQGGSARRSKSA